jgi:diguanylate cyclase (GGDEF)-like protein/PAS domain S-box-containing protein
MPGYFLFVRFLLRQLESSQARVVPRRVRATLDTLAEGVVVLDKQGQIVMANEAFAKATGSSTSELEGQKVSDFPWSSPVAMQGPAAALPWEHSLTAKESRTGIILKLIHDGNPKVLAVNSTPVLGEGGVVRGVLASFDNLTPIEEKNTDLQVLLNKLEKSKVKIQKQNANLKNLACKDPLTGCWNRRFFIDAIGSHWAAYEREGRQFSFVMVDIDHFKSINDNKGHSAGDTVLKEVSRLLQEQIRKADLVCRYGGEEFCILLPGQDLAGGMGTAERLRQQIEALRPLNLPVTASFGVSSAGKGAKSMQDLLDQADKALYVAKRSGRNKAQSWDEDVAGKVFNAKESQRAAANRSDPQVNVPYTAVNALLNILTYRHAATAEHCRRVADLCVATAAGILPHNDGYLLEMAALLHDIGKLGVPDAVLLKADPLTPEEWKLVKSHENLGDDLVTIAFPSEELAKIISGHHYRFEGDPEKKGLPKGDDIPLAARILAIADAFDSIVSDQIYRKARPQEEAFQELKRHAGKQFDPHLVEIFIQRVTERNRAGRASAEVAADECRRPSYSRCLGSSTIHSTRPLSP